MGLRSDDVYREVCQLHPIGEVIVPPRRSAVASQRQQTAPDQATGTCKLIAERGRMGCSFDLVYNGVPWWRPISVPHKRVIVTLCARGPTAQNDLVAHCCRLADACSSGRRMYFRPP